MSCSLKRLRASIVSNYGASMIIPSYERKYSPGNRDMKCIGKLTYTRDKDQSSQNEPIMTEKNKNKTKQKKTHELCDNTEHILISHALPVLFAVQKAVQPDPTFPMDAPTILALLRVKYAQLTPT